MPPPPGQKLFAKGALSDGFQGEERLVCFFVWSEMYTQVGGCEVSEVANRSLSAWSGEGCGLQWIAGLRSYSLCLPAVQRSCFPEAGQSLLAASGRINKVELSHRVQGHGLRAPILCRDL